MSNVIIDIGNSRVKIAQYNSNKLTHQLELEDYSDETIMQALKRLKGQNCILSSTKVLSQKSLNALKLLFDQCIVLDYRTKIPIENEYKSPETLGMDRIAAAVGAQDLFPEENVLVFDFGTCITMEFIDKSGTYKGGFIVPGLNMHFKAMHHFTDKLPLIELNEYSSDYILGTTTKESMSFGVDAFMSMGIDAIIQYFENKYGACRVILTGGDAKYFETKLKSKIFVHPNLVLLGLNKILTYNVS